MRFLISIIFFLSFCGQAAAITKTVEGVTLFTSLESVNANAIKSINSTTFNTGGLTTTATGSISYIFRGTNGSTFVLDWGHGTPEVVTLLGTGTNVTKSHNYLGVSGSKTITFRQGITNITYLEVPHTAATGGNLSNLASMIGLTRLSLYITSIGGNLTSLSNITGLTYLHLAATSVTGNLSSLSGFTSITNLYINSTAITGNLSSLSALTGLIALAVNDSTVSGNLSSLSNATGLTLLYLYVTQFTINSDSLPKWNVLDFRGESSGLTSTAVDNGLIQLAAAGGTGVTNCTINLGGTNAARTSASNAAKAILLLNGNVLIVKE